MTIHFGNEITKNIVFLLSPFSSTFSWLPPTFRKFDSTWEDAELPTERVDDLYSFSSISEGAGVKTEESIYRKRNTQIISPILQWETDKHLAQISSAVQ